MKCNQDGECFGRGISGQCTFLNGKPYPKGKCKFQKPLRDWSFGTYYPPNASFVHDEQRREDRGRLKLKGAAIFIVAPFSFDKEIIMDANSYQASMMRFISDTAMETNKSMLMDSAMGICGEAGEVADIIKKVTMQGHEYTEATRQHLALEIGDVLWYAAECALAIGYPLGTIMQMNIDKLEARYPDGKFDAKRSMNRKEGDI